MKRGVITESKISSELDFQDETTEKVFDSDTPVRDVIASLFMEQGIAIAINLIAVSMVFPSSFWLSLEDVKEVVEE